MRYFKALANENIEYEPDKYHISGKVETFKPIRDYLQINKNKISEHHTELIAIKQYKLDANYFLDLEWPSLYEGVEDEEEINYINTLTIYIYTDIVIYVKNNKMDITNELKYYGNWEYLTEEIQDIESMISDDIEQKQFKIIDEEKLCLLRI